MTTVQILRKARALVNKGWCQGRYEIRNPTKYCLLGALRKAGGDEKHFHEPSVDLLSRVTGKIFLYEWNDAPRRTKRQVLAAFDKAVKLAKETR